MMTDSSCGLKNDQDHNSLISMGTIWKTDEPGTDTLQGVKRVCSHHVQTVLGTQTFGAVGNGLYRPMVKRLECEVQSNADVKNM